MNLGQHWTITRSTVTGRVQTLDTDSGADAHERICEVLAARDMSLVCGGPGSISSIVRNASRVRNVGATVVQTAVRTRSSVRDLRSRLLEGLGIDDEEPRSAAGANVLLLNSLRSPYRVIFVRSAGKAPEECITFLQWLWNSPETNIGVIIEERFGSVRRSRAQTAGPSQSRMSGHEL